MSNMNKNIWKKSYKKKLNKRVAFVIREQYLTIFIYYFLKNDNLSVTIFYM